MAHAQSGGEVTRTMFDDRDIVTAWATRELGHAALGDARLTQRLVKLVSALSQEPATSIPDACGSWSDTKAAYRFFDNDSVTADAITAAHRHATLTRVREHAVILAVQDTTSFNFTLHRQTQGMGPIGEAGFVGFFLHSCLAVSTAGVPLGILASEQWARDAASKDSRRTRKHRPLEDKESARWLRVMEAATVDIPASTRVVMVADRESDILDLFIRAEATRHDLLVRAAYNRRLTAPSDGLVWPVLEAQPVLGRVSITVPRHDDTPTRDATLSLRSAPIALRPSKHRGPEHLPSPRITALLAREEHPPAGQKPIEWMLYTTLPVHTVQDAATYVQWYSYRWRIERYHYVLKSGCHVEDLQLETRARLERAIAVYRVVAWRLLWLTYWSRQRPDDPCTVALSQSEWYALYAAHTRLAELPAETVDLHTAVRWIAQLGGFLARRHDGEPGVKVIWRGYRRLQDLTAMWEILHPPDTSG